MTRPKAAKRAAGGRKAAPREGTRGKRVKGDAVRQRARIALRRLKKEYPDAGCALEHQTPLQLLIATILSAQCTDARVNLTTPALFARYPTAAALADADREDLEAMIRSTGFFRNKAKSLLGMARALVEQHGGQVPRTMDALRVLPGVGRKTANVVLGNAYGLNEGITVDTHVGRIVRLLGLTGETDAEKVERALMPLIPRKDWTLVSHLLIHHGRSVCIARRPRCGACVLADVCPSAQIA